MLLYHLLLLRITPDDQALLLQYENSKMDLFKLTNDKMRHEVNIIFPQTSSEIRRYITDGRYSIMRNFPVQRVFMIGNHACVSLLETIRIMAAHRGGFEFAWDGTNQTRNNSGLNGSQAVDDLVKDVVRELKKKDSKDAVEKTNIGFVYFWSDSFLRCFVKQRDNSVWIFTVTICPPHEEKSSGKYTFVLAMGRSSEDHTEVIDHFHNEVRGLMKGFNCYYGDRNECRTTALSLLMHVADRPERQAVGETRQEGDFGKVTNWAAVIPEEKFPACQNCYSDIAKEALMVGKQSTRKCNRCLCWNLSGNDPNMYPSVPDNYPKETIPDMDLIEERVNQECGE